MDAAGTVAAVASQSPGFDNRSMNRNLVGVIALTLMIGAGVVWLLKPDQYLMWLSALLRVGIVMSLLWLALPEFQRFPNWMLKVGLGIVLVIASVRSPRALALAIGVLLLFAFLKPRLDASPPSASSSRELSTQGRPRKR